MCHGWLFSASYYYPFFFLGVWRLDHLGALQLLLLLGAAGQLKVSCGLLCLVPGTMESTTARLQYPSPVTQLSDSLDFSRCPDDPPLQGPPGTPAAAVHRPWQHHPPLSPDPRLDDIVIFQLGICRHCRYFLTGERSSGSYCVARSLASYSQATAGRVAIAVLLLKRRGNSDQNTVGQGLDKVAWGLRVGSRLEAI